ncbi:uncharacterized protein TNCV_3650501 [Trichonephila clavipes]|uniref:Uncharacterized protein n=1 Tax=Trichonephila clavipes TaxID=2585209 RepID=A0A8X6S9Z2_TRICX|nr:uncharacterized protein TNCV_3650501 [Trichonephila clavipes]
MLYGYAAHKGSLECLFDLGVLGKIKSLVQIRIVRAQVPPSGEEIRHQNYIVEIGIHLDGATLKSDTSSKGMYQETIDLSEPMNGNSDGEMDNETLIKTVAFSNALHCLKTYLMQQDGLGLNPGEDMDVCKCIVPARHGGTLNSRRTASPLVRLVEGEEKWEASDHPQSVLPLNWGGIEPNQIVLSPVWCSKLRITTGVT